ncbi:MAG: hypothetical protein EAZ77_08650 [Nostocales cyanobacterium]|nr:MAG: hypothetical protein EAZ77_08650 [Nostocales cyanobacterium]
MPNCNCLPAHVPPPSYECGVYRISGTKVAGGISSFTISVTCLSRWNSGNNGQYDAFDWCDCAGNYGYAGLLAGGDYLAGSSTIIKIGNCQCSDSPAFDCINGACTNKTTYKTPGLYQSLEECQQMCGTGCGGVCISNSEWAQIQGLASQNKSKSCS